MTDLDRFSRPLWGERMQQTPRKEVSTTMGDAAQKTTIRTQHELFERFRQGLTPEVQRDIDHYLFLYDLFLDESDPDARDVLLGEMKLIKRKYNLNIDHTDIKSRPVESGQ